jgi:hypothetical protein
MPLTRTQDMAALKYIVETVLNQPVDGPIMKSLANFGIGFVSDLAGLRDVDILTMTYSTDEDVGTLLALSFHLRARLTAFCALMRYREILSLPIGDDWASITREEFDKFRINPVYDGTIHGMISTSNLSVPAASSHHARDKIADFKRGIKRDGSQFPTLKDEKQYDNWQRTTTAQARAQDVAEVLDPTYTPTTMEDKALFQEKQTFMYAVAEKTLLTDEGKAYVREFEKQSDAQSIYRRIIEHAIKSTEASLEASRILSYITSGKIGATKTHFAWTSNCKCE